MNNISQMDVRKRTSIFVLNNKEQIFRRDILTKRATEISVVKQFIFKDTHRQYLPDVGKIIKLDKVMVEAKNQTFHGKYIKTNLIVSKLGTDVRFCICFA